MTVVDEDVGGEPAEPSPTRRTGGAAALVATGILVSRVFGIFRQMLMARYLGASASADAFTASFKVTNFLQNLFGEGALSASFIPVYSKLLESGDEEEAGRVAGAVAALLALVVSIIVLIGVVATPVLIPLIAKGFTGEKRELTIRLTRILFPGAGIFVISAWCLGVLNSHRRFLLSYLAPVLWNIVMIIALAWAGPRQGERDLAVTLAWASVAGALLQFLVQVPMTLRLAKRLRIRPDISSPNVRVVTKNFGPAFVGRGVVQISSYIDNWLATFLPDGMVATFGYASAIFVLPVSLFGMSVSAAQLPEMSRASGDEAEIAAYLRRTLERGLRQIAYFVVPSAAAFVAFGDVIAAVLFQHGNFGAADTRYAWGILGGAAVGLLGDDDGAIVLVGLLRAPRHADAAALRRDSCRAHVGARLFLRAPTAGVARHRPSLGRGWPHRVGRRRRMDRVRDASRGSQQANRRHGYSWAVRDDAVGIRHTRGRRGMAHATSHCRTGTRDRGPRGARRVRLGVSRHDVRTRHSRGPWRHSPNSSASLDDARVPRAVWDGRRRSFGVLFGMAVPDSVLDKIPHLPESPGVYLWRDAEGTVLYVGKAKRLAFARAQLRRSGPRRERQDAGAHAVRGGARDDRRAERGARADPRGEPDQGVPPASTTSRCATTSRIRTSR